jgi:hypothetical protein
MPADLYWPDDGYLGYLHFTDPCGDYAVVPVTHGPTFESPERGPVWHVDIDDNVATVSPSIHFVGLWHSPNPVVFEVEHRSSNQPSRFSPPVGEGQ